MELTEEMVCNVLARLFRRCELIKLAGGIAYRDVVDGAAVPRGWILDWETDYFIPPGLEVNDGIQ